MGRNVFNVFPIRNITKAFPGVFNYLLISTWLVVIIASATASPAAGCTPTYYGDNWNQDKSSRRIVIIEGSSFRMSCHLSKFNSVKWTLDGKEIEYHLGRQLNIVVRTSETRHGEDIHTEINVTNATRQHSGEYKCVSLCHSHNHQGTGDSNNGAQLVVAFGENPTVDGEQVTKINAVEGENILTRLVRYSTPGRRNEVIKCNATNIKLIKWVKGASVTGNTDRIILCSERSSKAKSDESGEEDEFDLDAPCTEEVVEDNVGSGNAKSKNRQLNLVFNYVREEDFRPYTCVTIPQDSTDNIGFGTTVYFQETFSIKRLTPQNKPFDKGHRSVTVVAGNTLSIYCNITGANESEITVKWYKDDEELKPTEYHPRTKLWFDYLEAEAKHRGYYKCAATFSGREYDYQFYVRVKDKLLPLWPFLGICLNVAVLCVVIVIYEKRRNKTELEESDTDGSPDQ